MKSLILLVSLACGAAAQTGPYARILAAELRFSAEIPETWSFSARDAALSPTNQPDPDNPVGVLVELVDDPKSGVAAYLKDKSELGPGQRASQGITDFKAGLIEHRGPWSTVQTTARDGDAAPVKTVYAARAVAGGYYAVTYFAREPWFERSQAAFEHFLDTFKPEPPAASFFKFADPQGRYEVRAPSAPWTVSPAPGEGLVRFIGPEGAADEPRALLTIRRFAPGGPYADAEAFLKEEGESVPGHRAGAVERIRLPAGEARILEVATELDARDMPERRGPGRVVHFRARYAVLARKGEFYVLSYQAPGTAFEDFLPVYRKLLSSFRLLR